MRDLQSLGPTGDPLGNVLDAVFFEVGSGNAAAALEETIAAGET